MRARLAWYIVGLLMLGWGTRGLLQHVSTTQLIHAGRLFVLDVGGHDGLFAPLCVVAGALTERLLPRVLKTPVRIGLGFAVVLVVLALPSITSAHRLRSPSVLPLDYERNLAILLGLVALGVIVSGAVQLARERSRTRSRPPAA